MNVVFSEKRRRSFIGELTNRRWITIIMELMANNGGNIITGYTFVYVAVYGREYSRTSALTT
jgi:hypothetical protein